MSNAMTRSCCVLICCIAAFVAVITVPGLASAQTEDVHIESPQRFAFEARFGPYSPDIDVNRGDVAQCPGQGPYGAIFGAENSELMLEFEFDWQALDIFIGTLGIGLTMGVFHAEGKALQEGTCTASSEEANLWMLPFSLQAVIRFDIFAERWNVPLIPYAKAGLAYGVWWSSNADGMSESNNTRGYGGTLGMRVGGGIMLRLDWLERRAARTLDAEYGINHSYIFFEYYWAWRDGFGSDRRLNLSDATWAVGLALEM